MPDIDYKEAYSGSQPEDYKKCMVVFILGMGVIGTALLPGWGTAAGLGGGAIAGAAICGAGGFKPFQQFREQEEQINAQLGITLTSVMETQSTGVVTGISKQFNMSTASAKTVFDQALEWARANPAKVGEIYSTGNRSANNNSVLLPSSRTADVVISAASLGNA